MTVSSETNKNTYTGDGATTTFAYTFRILNQTHIKVQFKDDDDIITTKTLTTDYTVTNVGNSSGGNIVFEATSIPAATDTVIFTRAVPLKQETDYTENDTFPAESHEEALDELTMICQQQQEEIDRVLKVDASFTAFDGTITTLGANKYLKVNATNTGLEADTISTSGLASIVEDTTPQLGGTLDTNSQNIQFADSYGIQDSNGNLISDYQATASAVNKITYSNAATGNNPSITATGTDTNIGLNFSTKGTGAATVTMGGSAHTSTQVDVLTINASTSGTPAAGIGTSIQFNSESADENPAVLGSVGFYFSDVSAGSEDSVFRISNRAAGAAAKTAYNFAHTGTGAYTISGSTTSNITITLPDYAINLGPQVTKGWCHITGTGTASLDESFNVSSLVDNATGNFTINWDTDFSTATYSVSSDATEEGTGVLLSSCDTYAVGSVRCLTFTTSGTLTDPTTLSIMAIGDH